jgi:hypothetical protein
MMDIYVISPLSNLEPMKLGDRLFALAHLWMKSQEYRDFFYKQIDEDPDRWITLDCSAAERALVTEDVLIQVCHDLIPSEVIAPDVLFDKDATIKNAIKFRDRMEAEGLLEVTDIFFCPQGKTKEDWLECYEWGLKQDWIQTIGFSKIAIPQAWLPEWKDDQGIREARHMAYDYLKEKGMLLKPIHCLGQGSYTEFEYYDHPAMRSTDSVYPVLAAAHGIDFTKDTETRIPTPHNFLETFDMRSVDLDLVKSNIEMLKKSCRKEL